MISPLAFHRVVPLHSPFLLVGLAVVGSAGVVMLLMDPGAGDSAVVPVLFLQMFAASTGFAVPARRGHFDLLLTGGATRLRIALFHLSLSVAPGVAIWMLLAGCERVLHEPSPQALSSGTAAAFGIVSGVAWAMTVPLPRLSGGIIWLLGMVIALAAIGWRPPAALDAAPLPGRALVYALCPFVLVGRELDAADAAALAPAAIVSCLAIGLALAWMVRMDVALEAPQ